MYDPEIRRQLRALVDVQLSDDRKARIVDADGTNEYVGGGPNGGSIRSQEAFRDYLRELAEAASGSEGG